MLKLEEIRKESWIRGLYGGNAMFAVYRACAGNYAEQILFRSDEARLKRVRVRRPFSGGRVGAVTSCGHELLRERRRYE